MCKCVYTHICMCMYTHICLYLCWVGVPFLPPLPTPLDCQLLRTGLWSVSFKLSSWCLAHRSHSAKNGRTNGLDEWMTLSSESTASKENSGEAYRRWPGPGHLTPGLDPLPAPLQEEPLRLRCVCDFSALRIAQQLCSHRNYCGSQSPAQVC